MASATTAGTARKIRLLYLSLALLIPLAYVAITHHVWEDFLITFRHSRNLIEGKGLVFNEGRRVQGFTSAINVMAPALFYAISGKSESAALLLYRGLCLAAIVAAGWILLRILLREHPTAAIVFILLFVTESKTVAFTMNGQESALMVFFLALGMAAAHWGTGRYWPLLAISWTGLLYTRPDAPIFIMALAVAGAVFGTDDTRAARAGIAKATIVAAILFAPWFIFTWIYYGQPIPQTLLAKSNLSANDWIDPAGLVIQILSQFPRTACWVFQPIYADLGGWPDWLIHPYSLLCATLATGYWMIPSPDRPGRLASLLFMLTCLYMSFVNIGAYAAPWYLPSVAIFGTFAIASALGQLMQTVRQIAAIRAVQIYLVITSCALLAMQTWQIRIQQHEIEDNVRRPIGVWLHDVVSPDQRIYLEPIGYIGYYSDRLIWDWPGLITPEIVRLHREKERDRITIIPDILPEWIVLRDHELRAALPVLQSLHDRSYRVVRTFDARPALKKFGYIPGRGYIDFDSVFHVLKRDDVVPATTLPSQ